MRAVTRFQWCLSLGLALAFLVSCGPAAPMPTATPGDGKLILGATVGSKLIVPGGTEVIAIKLLEPGLPMDLTLFIEYADGQTQQIEQSAHDTDASLNWQVPTNAGAGPATFRLFANRNCTCGAGFPLPQSDVRGAFVVGTKE